MRNLLSAVLCLAALSGCSDSKQEKLETCMRDAEIKFNGTMYLFNTENGCHAPAKTTAKIKFCEEGDTFARQIRLEEEERCVKLYK